MKTLNLAMLEGTLTKKPELWYTANGTSYCKMTVKTDGNEITLTAWNKVADVCAEYLNKGDRVRAKGRLKEKDGKLHMEGTSIDYLKRAGC